MTEGTIIQGDIGRQLTIAPQQGMSLRDWFAGMAIQGIRRDLGSDPVSWVVAKLAYEDADAMLKEREK
jgi:hypothetical protein